MMPTEKTEMKREYRTSSQSSCTPFLADIGVFLLSLSSSCPSVLVNYSLSTD